MKSSLDAQPTWSELERKIDILLGQLTQSVVTTTASPVDSKDHSLTWSDIGWEWNEERQSPGHRNEAVLREFVLRLILDTPRPKLLLQIISVS